MDFGYPQTTESKILQEYVADALLPLLSVSGVKTLNPNVGTPRQISGIC